MLRDRWHQQAISARTARTPASPGAKRTVIPPISIVSVITRPSNQVVAQNSIQNVRDKVAGVLGPAPAPARSNVRSSAPAPAATARKELVRVDSRRARSAQLPADRCVNRQRCPVPGNNAASSQTAILFHSAHVGENKFETRAVFTERSVLNGFRLLLTSATDITTARRPDGRGGDLSIV